MKLCSIQGVDSRVQEVPGIAFKLHSDASFLDTPGVCLCGGFRLPTSLAGETGVLVLGADTASPQLCPYGAVLAHGPANAVTGSLRALGPDGFIAMTGEWGGVGAGCGF